MSPLRPRRLPNARPKAAQSLTTRAQPVCACLATALLAATSLPGCGTVGINDPERMTDEAFQRGASTAVYDHDADYVWLRVKETVVHLSSRQPDFNDDTRRAFATVEDGSIQVGVIAIDDLTCRMAVRARQYGLFSEELAESVLARIEEEIEPR